MDKIARIRQEIERNRQAIRVLNEHTAPEQMSKTCAIFQYSDSILSELLSFLDTLLEEPNKSLEEAADIYAEKHGFRVPYDGSNNYYDEVDVKASKEGYIAGAEWQQEQKCHGCFNRDEVFLRGMKYAKEQMMEEAVEGYVTFNYDAQKEGLPCATVIANEKPFEFYESRGFKLGDKVRIIILKDNEDESK